MIVRSVLALALFLITACAPAAAQAPISGFGKSIDGDSLMVGDKEVRLFGIDAPEFDQSCQRAGGEWSSGAAAADQLSKLVTGKTVVCTSVGTDDHGRILGRCMSGWTDVNRAMVATGYAVAYRRYSSDYVSAEESAKVKQARHLGGQVPDAERLSPCRRCTGAGASQGFGEGSCAKGRVERLASASVGQLQNQGQSQSARRLDLSHARHALLRSDQARRDILHGSPSAGCRLSSGEGPVRKAFRKRNNR